MRRFIRISLGFSLIVLGLIGFLFPRLQGLLLVILGILVLWSDIRRFLRLLDAVEQYFPGSKGPVQRLRQSFIEER